jgi:hypothetical protein
MSSSQDAFNRQGDYVSASGMPTSFLGVDAAGQHRDGRSRRCANADGHELAR